MGRLLYEMDTNGVAQALVVCAAIDDNTTTRLRRLRHRAPSRPLPSCGRPRLHLESHLSPYQAVPTGYGSSTIAFD